LQTVVRLSVEFRVYECENALFLFAKSLNVYIILILRKRAFGFDSSSHDILAADVLKFKF